MERKVTQLTEKTKSHAILTKRARTTWNWNNWYGYDDDDEEGSSEYRGALTSWWAGKWASNADEVVDRDGEERPEAYMRHLRSLRDTCNLAFGKNQLSVDWATNDLSATDISRGHIVLSPKPLKTTDPTYDDWTVYDRLDVLHATALHEGAHNKLTPANAMLNAKKQGGTWLAQFFNLMEDGYIEAEMMEEFPGSANYFDKGYDFHFTEEEIERRMNALLDLDLTRIEEPTEADEVAKVQEQLTAFVNVMIAACKSRNEVDLTPLYEREDERSGEVAEAVDKIVSYYRRCEKPGLDYEERLDYARRAQRVLHNTFARPLSETEEPKVEDFILNADEFAAAVEKMFSEGGVDASGGTIVVVGAADDGTKNEEDMISGETKTAVDGMMDANLRDVELEEFHTGSYGTLHEKAKIIDMRRKPHGDKSYAQTYEIVKKHKQRLKNALQFRSSDKVFTERELPRGRIDPTRLHNLASMKSRDIFMRRVVASAPSAHVGLLIDESGSMHSGTYGGHLAKDETARAACIMLQSALGDSKSISYEVWGHTGDVSGSYLKSDPTDMHEERYAPLHGLDYPGPVLMRYMDSKDGLTDPKVLGRMVGRGNNYDGYAIEVVTKNMLEKAIDAKRKVFMIVCDGMPAGSGYGGEYAVNHVAEVVRRARKNGIEVIAIFVGDLGHARTQMQKMYGVENRDWLNCQQPDDLPQAIEKIANRVLKWNGGAA